MKLSGRRTIVSLLLLSTLLAGSAVGASSASASTTYRPTKSEARLGWLINKERQHAHHWDLKYSPALSRIARAHSLQMARAGTIFHTKNLAYAFRSFRWTLGGENVGMGPSIDALHRAFVASPHHRDNNLDKRFHRFGIGVIWRRGIAYVTVEFLS